MKEKGVLRKALAAAFPHTLPIMAGFFFLGFSYGIYMNVSGFSFWYPMIMALVIFGGSLEFVAVSMLLSPFAPLQTLLVAFIIQARHLFYGLAMLEKYKGMGRKRFYLIYGMCDESFSINYTADIPEDVDEGWFMICVNALNQSYWVFSAALGGIVGNYIPFDTNGIEFVMTSMFVVIFLEQWFKEDQNITSIVGFGCSAVCLAVFGADSFLIPTMVSILVLLTVLRKPIEKGAEK